MWRNHLYLNWKKFWRSSGVGVNLLMRLLTWFSLLYIAFIVMAMGFAFKPMMEDLGLTEDLYRSLTRWTLFYIIADIAIRTMIMKIPFDRFESLILLPINKDSIIKSVIGSSMVNGFNVVPLLFLVPASLTVIYPTEGLGLTLTWLFSMVGLICMVHMLALRLKAIANSWPWVYFALFLIPLVSIYVDFKEIWQWTHMKHAVWWTRLIPALAATAIIWGAVWFFYRWNVRVMHSQAYLASTYRSQSKGWYASDFKQLDALGSAGDALREQLKLILRNKRLRTQLIFSLVLLPAGYIFFFNDMYEGGFYRILFSFFYMGLIPMSLAPYIWAHRADHVSLLHTMPISMHDYVKRQYIAYLFLTLLTAIPACIYLFLDIDLGRYFGASWLYMAGMMLPSLMLASVFNRKPMEINTSGTFNTQGVSMSQMVIVMMAQFLPSILFVMFDVWGYTATGLWVIAGMGILGLLCIPLWLRWITNWSINEKYALHEGFRQQK